MPPSHATNATALEDLLKRLREESDAKNDYGYSFEQLCRVFLEKDKVQRPLYTEVQFYKNWASAQGSVCPVAFSPLSPLELQRDSYYRFHEFLGA